MLRVLDTGQWFDRKDRKNQFVQNNENYASSIHDTIQKIQNWNENP